MKIRILVLIGLLSIGELVSGQNKYQKIDSFLVSLSTTVKFNGNVLIAEKGKAVYKKSFGLANEDTRQKLNENSIFELASVSKQFTAMAIVILKEQGKLNYEDKISKYIPELANYDKITIKHLLNHTGGLPDYMQIMDTVFDKSKIATNKDIISIFSKLNPPVLFEPNTQWEYSNTGYALLASIIEKASGMSYGNYLKKCIFQPLKMKNTFVYRRRYAPSSVDNYAYGYVYSDSLKQYILPDELPETNQVIWLDGIVGDGTVNSTTMDLLKWDRALYANKLISNESKKEIFSSSKLNDKSKTNYGFGWFVEDNGVYGNFVRHTGGWPGYRTIFERHIQNDKTIIVLMNHENKNFHFAISDVRKILYGIEATKFILLNDEGKKKFAGDYKNDKGKIRSIGFENGMLYRLFDSGDKLELRPISATKFQMIGFDPDVFYEFVLNENKVEKIISTQPETKTTFELIRVQ